ncbi:MAG TPA: histidinol-phosphate transaminase [Steroidobacteraceae bacterium]|nr:histidinol-phosphate transaminase [Steroidobacteraceae bacterium]
MSAAASPLELARAEIRSLAPYEHAAWEPSLERLHANELPWRAQADATHAGLNRYPEPQPRELVMRLAELYGVEPAAVLVSRGSDEGIDLLTRAFCRAGSDAVVVCPPTFGMYAVAARIQGATVIRVPLIAERGFALDVESVLARCTPQVKLVFLCSPNNPTGNLMAPEAILELTARLAGRALVVLDEAYIEFADAPSLAAQVAQQAFLVVLRTLSKAHGLAGARCGALIAAPEIVALLRKIIPPYALTQTTIETVCERLQPPHLAAARERVALIRSERAQLARALAGTAGVRRVWPSEANFVLAEFEDASAAFAQARAAGLLVRDVRAHPGLERALRITVGTPEQNRRLIQALQRVRAEAV